MDRSARPKREQPDPSVRPRRPRHCLHAHGEFVPGPLGEILHCGAMGSTRSGENVRDERQGTPAQNNECRANGAGRRRRAELSSQSVPPGKIFIVGHSWGSMLGLWLAHEHPEWIYAFVGTGQAVSMQENEVAGYRIVLQTARDRHNELAIKELESVAPYPRPVQISTKRTW